MKLTSIARRTRLIVALVTACGFVLLGSVLPASAGTATAGTVTNPKHFFWSNGQPPNPNSVATT